MTPLSQRRIAASALALAASRALVFLVPLIATPIFSRMFDDDTFGAWTILGSVFTLLSSQDFGICSAYRVRLAGLQVTGDDALARRQFLSIFAVIVAGAIILSAGIALVRPPIGLLGLPPADGLAAYIAIGMALIAVASAVPFHAMYAYLESEWVAASDVIRALLQIFAAGLIYLTTTGLVPCLVIFYSPWLLYVLIIYFILMYRRKWRGYRGSRLRDWWIGGRALRALTLEGLPFWVLQLLNLALGPLDFVLAGTFLGLAEAGSLGLVLRLVNVGYAFLGAVAWGYAGAYGLQYARGDYRWITKTISAKIGLMVALGILTTGALVMFGETVIRVWSGRVVAEHGVYLMSGIVFLTGGVGRLLLSVLQGIGRVGRVLLPLLLCTGFKIGAAIVLIPHWHADGLLAASSLANLAVAAVAAFQLAVLLRASPDRALAAAPPAR